MLPPLPDPAFAAVAGERRRRGPVGDASGRSPATRRAAAPVFAQPAFEVLGVGRPAPRGGRGRAFQRELGLLLAQPREHAWWTRTGAARRDSASAARRDSTASAWTTTRVCGCVCERERESFEGCAEKKCRHRDGDACVRGKKTQDAVRGQEDDRRRSDAALFESAVDTRPRVSSSDQSKLRSVTSVAKVSSGPSTADSVLFGAGTDGRSTPPGRESTGRVSLAVAMASMASRVASQRAAVDALHNATSVSRSIKRTKWTKRPRMSSFSFATFSSPAGTLNRPSHIPTATGRLCYHAVGRSRNRFDLFVAPRGTPSGAPTEGDLAGPVGGPRSMKRARVAGRAYRVA